MKKIANRYLYGILSILFYSASSLSDEINTDFLFGMASAPAFLKKEIKYPSGSYYIDINVNGTHQGHDLLIITPQAEKKGVICLHSEWLKSNGVFFKPSSYRNFHNKENDCYEIERESNTKIDFNYNTQSLDISIPQAYQLSSTDAARWDYGTNGFRLTYSGNANKRSNDSITTFGHLNMGLNLGRWILSSNMNISHSNNDNSLKTNDISLSTAINQIQGNFVLGRSQTRIELFSDFAFYGAALLSNSDMRPWAQRGYAPTISGIANSTSRITITQGGYTIYSKVVPPGPYQFTDISPVSNGDITVTVENSSGHKTSTLYPVATLPSLLRPGEINYNLAVGERSLNYELKDAFSAGTGIFGLGSVDYGFSSFTSNAAILLHTKYQNIASGITKPLGSLGAISTSISFARSKYDNDWIKNGTNLSLKYAKSFTNNTNLQLLAYRYQSKGYVEFANFIPSEYEYRNQEKARYEARLFHSFPEINMSTLFWQQTYWNNSSSTFGANIIGSRNIYKNISLYLNGSYSKNPSNRHSDYAISANISIPLNFSDHYYYNNNSFGYSRNSGSNFSTSVSTTVNDRLSYNLNANTNSKGKKSITGVTSYTFDTVQTNFLLSQDSKSTSLSGNISGSAIITQQTGFLLTKQSDDTLAIIKIKDMPGIQFNNSLPTNSSGETVVYLSNYSLNTININPQNLPNNIELLNTSYNVIPTEKAIIYREFNIKNVKRYILRVYDAQRKIMTGGSAMATQRSELGFISGNGILLINTPEKPKKITVEGNDISCSFNMSNVKANLNMVQEVYCE